MRIQVSPSLNYPGVYPLISFEIVIIANEDLLMSDYNDQTRIELTYARSYIWKLGPVFAVVFGGGAFLFEEARTSKACAHAKGVYQHRMERSSELKEIYQAELSKAC